MSTSELSTIDQTRARVRQALRVPLGDALDDLHDNDDLRETLGERYDSLRAMECISQIESEFGIEVDFVTHDVRYVFATVERISAFVQDQLEDQAVIGSRS
jgi:acyl carrier protein